MTLSSLTAHLGDDADHLADILGEAARRVRASSSGPRLVREEKRCPRCETVKPIDDFGVDRSRPDGRHGFCRACRRPDSKE